MVLSCGEAKKQQSAPNRAGQPDAVRVTLKRLAQRSETRKPCKPRGALLEEISMARIGRHSLMLPFVAASLLAQQQLQSPLPELPSDIPRHAVLRMVQIGETLSGQDAVWKSADGSYSRVQPVQ